ncbi:hypothetical protein CcaverHIS002_0105950 [Cutaneotrichosporon cavernicola]|uniref:Uncharacterized protein n=1 Tax=Cutaneotrichosporon cavernicola TaxID=279322 RepID=A0AA48IBN2_9TREE|nr:uncharacterized protein CcaverHIS019_0105890 [Cutaneotrichosporon cavernicola]BEI80066.1 hypothetical protein CcaverHIS002_0105950 [Cutaneotrichosporon cavernicola]BEI87871.1 hypothetical protein CcaverHIS019_0105890 [Cutaneotrichosporon cavernicola]BEI95645.1 hypothetical protein CcaverHIS631_0105940 [Cutaneotrichosporon cavernicola]
MGLAISKRRRRHRVTRIVSPGVDPDALRARLAPLERNTPSPTAGYPGLDAYPNILASISEHADARTLVAMGQVSHAARDAALTAGATRVPN